MMKRKYSIIVPVYNVEKYINECLSSLINQTYKNIEIVVINDGSSDNSLSLIEEYSRIDDRIRVIDQKNMGLGYTRNVGIDNAVGDYILFVDSDDYISLNTCEEIEAVLSYNNEVDIIVLGRYRFADEVYMQDPISKGKTCFETGESYLLHCVKNECFTASSCNKVFNRSFLEKNELRFDTGVLYEDLLFVFKALICSSSLIVMDSPYYYYRWNRKDSIINTIKEKDKDVLYTVNMMEKFLVQKNKIYLKENALYKELIFTWVCNALLFKYPQKKPFSIRANRIVKEVLNDMNFKKYVQYFLVNRSVKKKWKLVAFCALYAYPIFVIGIYLYFNIYKRRS